MYHHHKCIQRLENMNNYIKLHVNEICECVDHCYLTIHGKHPLLSSSNFTKLNLD